MIQYPGSKFYLNLSSPMISDNVKLIQSKLVILNLLRRTDVDGYFGVDTEKAVKSFQKRIGLNSNGIVDKTTWDKLFENSIAEDVATESNNNTSESSGVGSNNNSSFFNSSRKQSLRKNGNDIIIKFGNEHRIKTLKQVVYRSKSVIINAGGEPIAETYDFIAKDLIESEEE